MREKRKKKLYQYFKTNLKYILKQINKNIREILKTQIKICTSQLRYAEYSGEIAESKKILKQVIRNLVWYQIF